MGVREKRAGNVHLLRHGDVVWDLAVVDRESAGRPVSHGKRMVVSFVDALCYDIVIEGEGTTGGGLDQACRLSVLYECIRSYSNFLSFDITSHKVSFLSSFFFYSLYPYCITALHSSLPPNPTHYYKSEPTYTSE